MWYPLSQRLEHPIKLNTFFRMATPSRDGILQIIYKLAHANTHIFLHPNNGIYDASNQGISRSIGDVINLMHLDDFFAASEALADITSEFKNFDINGI